jgi:hypothetical protein
MAKGLAGDQGIVSRQRREGLSDILAAGAWRVTKKQRE